MAQSCRQTGLKVKPAQSCALKPLIEGSTKPVEVRHHAGVVPVKRFRFVLP
jgi:hypothetical protein